MDNNLNNDFDEEIKSILIGDPYVGKSSFCNKLVGYTYPLSYETTIGVDYFKKILDIDNKNIKLLIWDTTGHEKYRSITRSFYRNVNFVILVFDLNNEKSFLNLKNWINNVNLYCKTNINKVLVGNKSDLKNNVNKKDIEIFCNDNKLNYYECSVKNDNIEDLIITIYKENLEKHIFKIDENVLKLTNNNNDKNCCIIL